MAKRRKVAVVAWQIGEVRKNQKVDGDGDGRPIDDWIQKNADMAGKSKQDWLNDAVANLRDHGREQWMKDVPDLHDSNDVKGVLDGVYSKYGDGKTGSDQIFHMWKDAGAKYDPSWQYRTTVAEKTGKTQEEKVWDLSKKSWVTKEVPVVNYLDPQKVPYLVRSGVPKGSIFKATFVDAKGVSHEDYLTVGDTGTNRAEMSDKALQNLGIHGGPNGIAEENPYVSLQYLGQGSSAFPTQESIRADGKRLEEEYKKQQEDKKKPKGKDKHADAQTQGGVQYLAKAPDHGVGAGVNRLLVAVAHPDCVHSGQVPVTTGSCGIVVGVAQSPLAGEGDLTKDGLVIRKGTGDQTIDMV